MLFDWIVTGHVFDVNPSPRGPKYGVEKARARLTADEARELLDGIAITQKTQGKDHIELQESEPVGLHGRPLWGMWQIVACCPLLSVREVSGSPHPSDKRPPAFPSALQSVSGSDRTGRKWYRRRRAGRDSYSNLP
jgi:hypothetical protein